MYCQCDVCFDVVEELRSARLDPATIKSGHLLSLSEAIIWLPPVPSRTESYQVFNLVKGREDKTVHMELKFSPQSLMLED